MMMAMSKIVPRRRVHGSRCGGCAGAEIGEWASDFPRDGLCARHRAELTRWAWRQMVAAHRQRMHEQLDRARLIREAHGWTPDAIGCVVEIIRLRTLVRSARMGASA